jgi:hypothetical protein
MKRIILFFIICLGICIANAQVFTFLQATQQQWYGGICCSHGTNYLISFESTDTIHNITIDTVWIGNKFYTTNSKNSFLIFNSIVKGKMNYQLTIAESWNANGIPDNEIVSNESKIITLIYNGQACVVYHYRKKKMVMLVENIIELPPIAYP